jgi:hypothetical protein
MSFLQAISPRYGMVSDPMMASGFSTNRTLADWTAAHRRKLRWQRTVKGTVVPAYPHRLLPASEVEQGWAS